jgi:Hsp20/alpha crystallin family
MSTLTPRDYRGPLGDMVEWLEAPWAAFRPVEFRNLTFSRSVTLPATADPEYIGAFYGHGILEVAVRLSEPLTEQVVRTVPVRQDQHIKPT